MIEKLSCCGYRGFADEQTLELAVPTNNKRGSGLTVLIGPNGGGKSTVMECFLKISEKKASFSVGKRNQLAGDRVSIKIIDKNDVELGEIATIESGGCDTKWKSQKDKPKIYYLPSRRVFNPYFGEMSMDRVVYIKNLDDPQFRGSSLDHFSRRLFETIKNPKDFNKIFWKILGKELHWTVDRADTGQYYVRVAKPNGIYHNSDGLGEGVVSLMFITDALLGAKNGEFEVIAIDEPELSLHPQLQKRLLDELLEITRNKQVVISTHSANMISVEAVINGGQIARVFERDNRSVIECIDKKCRGYLKSFYSNLHNPHIIGNEARQCFFAEDGYIITEGQDDVVLLPKVLNQLGLPNDIALFGFGAGGAENISKVAYILRCLGFSHIGALYDGDKRRAYNKFNRDFGKDEGFKAWILPANDVRDKPNDKCGLLGKGNRLKPEYKNNGELKNFMNEMIEFSKNHR